MVKFYNRKVEDVNAQSAQCSKSCDLDTGMFPPSSTSGSSTSSSEVARDFRKPQLQQAVDFLHAESEFLEAAEYGDEETLNYLISNGANVHLMDPIGRNALHLAICSGNTGAITTLLEAGVDPNVEDNMGQTPLSLCLWRCPSLILLKLLFSYGAVLEQRSNVMDTGLFLQFMLICTPTEEEEDIIYLLVEQGALINDPDAPGGRQALHLAAMCNNCELIGILYTLGANIYLTNINNQTAKEFALAFKCKEAYNLLDELEDTFVDSVSLVSGKSLRVTRSESSGQ